MAVLLLKIMPILALAQSLIKSRPRTLLSQLRGAVVGMGAVVIRDVPFGVAVDGNLASVVLTKEQMFIDRKFSVLGVISLPTIQNIGKFFKN